MKDWIDGMSESTTQVSRPLIEVLYFDGCPNHETLLPHLHDLLAQHALIADIVTTRVDSDHHAQSLRFLGSPTVRVNGRDIDPSASSRAGYGLQCRLYRTHDGVTGTPPDAWILAALHLDAEVGATDQHDPSSTAGT